MNPPNPAAATPGSRNSGDRSGVGLSGRDQFLLWLGLFLLQFMLWTNPGYFSHDELQWGHFASARTLSEVPWASWTDVATFQYRPVTFNLWMLLSRYLLDTPFLFHAVFVGLGTLNAVLLARVVVAVPGGSRGAAFAAGVAFVLSPYTAFIHGWIATIADLIWVGCGLGLAQHLARRRPPGAEFVVGMPSLALVFVLTAVALLAKEAAVVLPGFALLAWLVDRRQRAWLLVLAASALPVAIYLGLRVSVILFAPRTGSTYTWAASAIPERVIDYLAFPFKTGMSEISGLSLHSLGSRLQWAAGTVAMWLVIAWRAPRIALFTVLGTLGSLAPVLILTMSATQYAYAYAAVFAAGCALAWAKLRWPGRGVLLALGLVIAIHGVQLQREFRIEGKRAAAFLPAVAAVLAEHPETPLRLLPTDHPWLYTRLTFNVPAWRGVPFGDRITIVAQPPADYRVTRQGKLEPYVEPVTTPASPDPAAGAR